MNFTSRDAQLCGIDHYKKIEIMKKTMLACALLMLAFTSFGQGLQENARAKDWGLEFNVLWPFVPGVEIYTAKATNTLWRNEKMRGDLTFGLLLRPQTKDDENAETFREFGLNIGYRQYLIREWHVELAIYPSFAKEKGNFIDGGDYQGFAITAEFYTGYKFTFARDKAVSWYVMPQAGIGYNPYADLGPATEPGAPFPAINLQVGISF